MTSKTAVPYTVLVLRLVTLGLLAASLAVIATDNYTDDYDYDPPRKFTFKDIYAYKYVLAVAAIGCAYTLLQIPFAAVSIVRGKRGTDNVVLLLICADIVAALLLATGAAAGFGFTYDMKRDNDRSYNEFYEEITASPKLSQLYHDTNRFLMLAVTSAGLMLWAAACVAITSMVSAYSLVK